MVLPALAAGGLVSGVIGLRRGEAETQREGAQQAMGLDMLLTAADTILQQQRDAAARRAMVAELKAVDEEYGVGDTDRAMRNKAIINKMASDVGADVAAPMQEQTTAGARQRGLNRRRNVASRGVGGSVEESAKREEKQQLASDVATTGLARETAEEGYMQGIESERLTRRQGIRDRFQSPVIELPRQQIQQAAGMETASRAERYRGVLPIIGEGVNLGLDIGKLAMGAAG